MNEITKRNKITEEDIFLKVYKSIFTSGLAAELGRGKLATLIAIASYIDEDGICYPTQQQLAERLGTTIGTINRDVKELLALRIQGKPILTRVKYKTKAGHYNSVYRVMPISQLTMFNREVEPIEKLKIADKEEISERERMIAKLLE